MRFQTALARAAVSLLATFALGTVMASAPVPARAGGTTHQVQTVDFAFAPAELTITAGDTVTWTNLDQAVHTATSTTGAFDSGDLDQGQSYSLTFTATGTFDYLCSPHPQMTGRIVVQAVAGPPPTPAPTPGPTAQPLPNVAMHAPVAPSLATTIGVVAAAACLVAITAQRRRRG